MNKTSLGLTTTALCLFSAWVMAGLPEPMQVAQLEASILPDPPGGGGEAFSFATAVAVDGQRAAVGGNYLFGTGAVHIYELLDGQWQQTAELRPLGGAVGDEFGGQLMLSGQTLLVSATGDDELGSNTGAVYVFELLNNSWQQVQKIPNPDAVRSDHFGRQIRMFNDQLFITAANLDGPSRVEVYEKSGQNWLQVQTLEPPQPGGFPEFGNDLLLAGGQLLVGAPGENDFTGVVYVYESVNGMWQPSGSLVPAGLPPQAGFGSSLISTPQGLFITASIESQPGIEWGGAVYRFTNNGGAWLFTDKLIPSVLNDRAYFGAYLAYENDRLYVSSTGLENSSGIVNGAIHVFDLQQNMAEVALIRQDETDYTRYFGAGMAVSNGRLVVSDYRFRNAVEQSRGRGLVLAVDNGYQVEAELVGPGGSAMAQTGEQVMTSGDWMMVDRTFITEQSQNWRDGIEIYQRTTQGWLKTQEIRQLSEVVDVQWHLMALQDDTALLSKRVITNNGTTELLEVFERTDQLWQFSQVLTPFDGLTDIGFGSTLALDGQRLAVGAQYRPDGEGGHGAVYFFEKNDDVWQDAGMLIAGDELVYGALGQSLVLAGDFLAAGINQRIPNDTVYEVHLYQLDMGQWVYRQTIQPMSGDHHGLGLTMAMNPGQLFLYEHNTLQQPFGVTRRFLDNNGTWHEVTPLIPPATENNRNDATSIDFRDGRVLIGQAADQERTGRVHLFQLDGEEASYIQSLTSPRGNDWDEFASQAVFSSTGMLISAPQDSEHGRFAGAVHSYEWVDDLIFRSGMD
jgi:hypothetical protein